MQPKHLLIFSKQLLLAMNNLINISFLDDYYSFFSLVAFGIIGFSIGFFIKQSIIGKKQKRIIELEDDLLKKDSTILRLEQKIADITKDSGKKGMMHKVS